MNCSGICTSGHGDHQQETAKGQRSSTQLPLVAMRCTGHGELVGSINPAPVRCDSTLIEMAGDHCEIDSNKPMQSLKLGKLAL